jgi:uncharacterized protein with PIN domain
VMKRRVITLGKLRAFLVSSDDPEKQIQQVIETFQLDINKPLSLCLECNALLVAVNREEIKDRVPPYVYQTKSQFVECPVCHRVYWQGTHWEAITQTLSKLSRNKFTEK